MDSVKQSIKLKHTVLAVSIGGGYDALFGKPFLARIDKKVDIRYDYLEAPTRGGVPVIFEGRKYLGNRH